FCSGFYAEICDNNVFISFGIDQSYFNGSTPDCGVFSLNATVQLPDFLNMFEDIRNSIPPDVIKLAQRQT
ncbi:MAG: hypothetical protein IJS50_01920, partial [Desulfovibrio sp.]|nr:hypothetical protein [Desulfovibrio sp.]